MDIRLAILGLLNWQPLSGYDLKKIIAESELFYWSASNNQIYNSLVTLHKQGMVSQEVYYQESLPAKKIYSITETGRAEMHRWLLSDPELPEFHDPFLIQLAWADALNETELDALLARYAEEITVQLRMRATRANKPPTAPNRTLRERLLWERIEEHLRSRHERELEWVNQLRQDIQNRDLLDES